jgi:hypothetical protein
MAASSRTDSPGGFASGKRFGQYFRATWPRTIRVGFYVLLALLAAVYGLTFGLDDGDNLLQFFTPLVVLLVIAFWVMPDVRYPPVKLLHYFVVGMLIFYLCWPDYIALALANLPWITPMRATGIPMGVILLLCAFGSRPFRRQMGDIMRGDKFVVWAFTIFVVYAGVTIAYSKDMPFSTAKYVVLLYAGAVPFFTAMYVFNTPGRVRVLGYYLWIIALFNIVIGLYESQYRHLPWQGDIPPIFKIEDPKIQALLAGSQRAASGKYRVQSKFSTPIGLGEYLGFALPFMLHMIFSEKSKLVKIALLISIGLALDVVLETDSRLAFICFVSSIMLYIFYQTLLLWRAQPHNIFAPAIMMAYPVFMAMFIALALFWKKLSVLVFGGGEAQASTEGRQLQVAKAMPKIFGEPWGHGIGMGAKTAGMSIPGSTDLTIDSYFLSVAVEYGLISFFLFYGMFVWAIGRSTMVALKSRDKELLYLGAVAVALANFFISKSVYSQQENHPLAFLMLGIFVAFMRRYKAETGKLPPVPQEDALYRPHIEDFSKDWQRRNEVPT